MLALLLWSSVGSTDLHSIVELHLSGPSNTSTTFIEVEKFKKILHVPNVAKI